MQQEPAFTTLVREMQNLAHQEQEETLETILKRLEPKIQQALYQTTPDRRDDLEQEIRIKLMEITRNYQWKEGPAIDQFVRWE